MGIPTTLAIAAVAVLGYLVGVWRRRDVEFIEDGARRELRRASAVVRQLEKVAREIRHNLTVHHASVAQFKSRMADLGNQDASVKWRELSDEADRLLAPTTRLATEIAHAYDEVRQQANLLMTFTEVRTDPLTGLSNRRALDESIANMLAMLARYGNPFSIAILDIDHFKQVNDEHGHLHGDKVIQQVAELLDHRVKETDIVARYGGEEFVILMPETTLGAACSFSERVREKIERELSVTISAGVTAALDGDNPRTLLARADAALYEAKSAGRNAVHGHVGHSIVSVTEGDLPAELSAGAEELLADAEELLIDAEATLAE